MTLPTDGAWRKAMKRMLCVVLLLLVAGCDPFLAEVDARQTCRDGTVFSDRDVDSLFEGIRVGKNFGLSSIVAANLYIGSCVGPNEVLRFECITCSIAIVDAVYGTDHSDMLPAPAVFEARQTCRDGPLRSDEAIDELFVGFRAFESDGLSFSESVDRATDSCNDNFDSVDAVADCLACTFAIIDAVYGTE
jgi:hypothetical protein